MGGILPRSGVSCPLSLLWCSRMPIPYRDADDLDELGTVAYLKIEPVAGGSGYLGALLLINARGEPVEFTYNRIDTPTTFLWRQDDLRRHAARKLTASLFSLCPRTPRLCCASPKRWEANCFARIFRCPSRFAALLPFSKPCLLLMPRFRILSTLLSRCRCFGF